MLIYYPSFYGVIAECKRINNLNDREWSKLIEENQQKLRNLTDTKRIKYLSDFAREGGLATKKKHGVEFYKRISKLGVMARKNKKEGDSK
jgi:hypothetical protein